MIITELLVAESEYCGSFLKRRQRSIYLSKKGVQVGGGGKIAGRAQQRVGILNVDLNLILQDS